MYYNSFILTLVLLLLICFNHHNCWIFNTNVKNYFEKFIFFDYIAHYFCWCFVFSVETFNAHWILPQKYLILVRNFVLCFRCVPKCKQYWGKKWKYQNKRPPQLEMCTLSIHDSNSSCYSVCLFWTNNIYILYILTHIHTIQKYVRVVYERERGGKRRESIYKRIFTLNNKLNWIYPMPYIWDVYTYIYI